MSDKPILFVVNFREGVSARLWLNDLPVHKGLVRGANSMTGGANNWLVPGENTLALEIHHVPTDGKFPSVIDLKFYTVEDPNAETIQENILFTQSFPELWNGIPEEKRRLPYMHTTTFVLPDANIQEPVYFSATPAFYECNGTPELREALQELHDALSSADAERFLKLTALKAEEYERAFPGIESASASRREAFIRRFFSLKPRVKPLDFSRIHFEPRSNGRVAYVSGADDEPVLHAIASAEPDLALRANLMFTRVAGAWRVFA